MFDRILLTLFFVCLLGCAGMVLGGIWIGEHVLPPLYFQTAASFFVVGLTTFLTWFVSTVWRLVLWIKYKKP